MSAPMMVPTCADCNYQWDEDGTGRPACCPKCDGDSWAQKPETPSASAPKHTPGPWKFVQDSEFPALGHVVAFTGDTVELIDPVAALSDERQVATSRLIAAAPDLKVALGVAAAALENVASGFRYQGNIEMYEFYSGKAHEARAAIARAEGRS